MASTIYSALARMASSNARDFADQNRLGEYILLLAGAFHVVLANLASINFCECQTLVYMGLNHPLRQYPYIIVTVLILLYRLCKVKKKARI